MAVKRKATSDIAEEVDDFEADARLMRKMKKGKLSQKELKSIMWTNITIQKNWIFVDLLNSLHVKVFSNEDHLCFGEKAVFLLTVFVICFNFSNKFYNSFSSLIFMELLRYKLHYYFYYFVYFHRFLSCREENGDFFAKNASAILAEGSCECQQKPFHTQYQWKYYKRRCE